MLSASLARLAEARGSGLPVEGLVIAETLSLEAPQPRFGCVLGAVEFGDFQVDVVVSELPGSPSWAKAQAAGLRVMVNNFAHLVMPLLFGSLGAALGFFPVFLTNSAILVAGGTLMRWSSARDAGTRQPT
jgi:hypothetical protein